MKAPLSENTPINNKRFKRWTDRFGSYRSGVTRLTIEDWLNQFEEADRDLAARVLDSILYFGKAEMSANYQSLLNSIEGWHSNKNKRKGRWFFAAMTSGAGESGDGMLYDFRLANNLDGKSHKEMFIHPRDLVLKKLGPEDTVVLVDDFSGTGSQVCDLWTDPAVSLGELVAGAGRVFLMVVAATKVAKDKISEETDLRLAAAHMLNDKDNLFSDRCTHFSKSEKTRILNYNKTADNKCPKGFGESGLLVVFCHRCPNNSLPILRVDSSDWTAIFPRHD